MRQRPWEVSSERARTIVIIVVVGLIAAVSFRFGFLGGERGGLSGLMLNGSTSGWPDRPKDAEDEPIGTPPRIAGGGTHAFLVLQEDDETPVTYDPCVPIHIVVNNRTAVDNADRLVDEAIDEVSAATGLKFVLNGTTSERPSTDRPVQVDRYGKGWAPVLIAWSDDDEIAELEGSTAGLGGSRGAARDGHLWFVTGGLSLDGPQLAAILDSPGGWESARAVVMHELGHVVGLNHVDAEGELMQPRGSADRTGWGPGDREGLAALGSGPCVDY